MDRNTNKKHLQTHITAQTDRRDISAQWQVHGQGAEHDSFKYNTARHSWIRFYTVSVWAKLSYATDSLQTLAQTIHSLHQVWGSLSHCPRQRCEDRQSEGSAVKTDNLIASLKKMVSIRGANQLSVAPALTVDRFLIAVQRALKLEHNLAFTTTNGDLCVILFVVFSFAQG